MSDKETYTKEDVEVERAHAQRAEEKAKDAEKRLKELEAKFKDIDLDAYKKSQDELNDLKIKASAGSEDKIKERIKEAEAAVTARLQKAVEEERARAEQIAKDLKRERVTKQIRATASEAFGQDTLDLLEPVFDKDGDFEDGQIVFRDAKGNIRYSEKDRTKPLSTEEYVGELINKYPTAARATSVAGSKSEATKIVFNGNGKEITSMAEASRLPDKGAALFKELARTPEGQAKLDKIMQTAN